MRAHAPWRCAPNFPARLTRKGHAIGEYIATTGPSEREGHGQGGILPDPAATAPDPGRPWRPAAQLIGDADRIPAWLRQVA